MHTAQRTRTEKLREILRARDFARFDTYYIRYHTDTLWENAFSKKIFVRVCVCVGYIIYMLFIECVRACACTCTGCIEIDNVGHLRFRSRERSNVKRYTCVRKSVREIEYKIVCVCVFFYEFCVLL